MHHAPSVTYPVGRCRFAAAVSSLIWLCAAAVLAGWALRSAAPAWQVGLAAFGWLAAGVLAGASWLRSPRGHLAWHGAEWRFGDVPCDAPELTLDLQRWLLVRAAGRWLWLERDAAPADWDALRRAVYSRAGAGVPRGAQPPAA